VIHALDGDILLPKPSWVSYSSIAKLIGKNLTRFNLDRDKDFRLNIDRVDEAYRSAISKGQNPTSIIINSPNNPVGNSFSKKDIESVSTWAKQKELTILSDEIYSLITHSVVAHSSPSTYYPEKTIVFGGLSKHLSLGGWRIGIAILPNNEFGSKLGSHFNAVAGSIWSCVPAPFQIMAETAFGDDEQIEKYIQTCAQIHETRTHYVYHGLKELGLNCPKPTGAFYVYASFKNFEKSLNSMGIDSCQKLAEYLLNKYEIATLPGSAFGDDPENLCLRISTSYLDMETDQKAQQILDNFSNGIDSTLFMKDYHPRTNLFLSRMNKFLSSLN
jgi:aspartate/methionine/tyrosine aminotransferase